jgi:hypothetical protein
MMRRAVAIALLAGGLAVAAGCATPEVGEKTAAQWDGTDAGLSDPAITFSVFERAMREGDLDTLARVFAAGALDDLIQDVAARGRDEVSAWYKRDSERFVFADPEWVERGARLAYLRVRIARRAVAAAPGATEGGDGLGAAGAGRIVFAFAAVRGAWRITGFKSEADGEQR